MAGTSLNQNLNQSQTLAPQMRQSLEVLQANALELQHLLRQFIETNPVLEHDLASLSLEELDPGGSEEEQPIDIPDDDLRELAIMERRTSGSSKEDAERGGNRGRAEAP